MIVAGHAKQAVSIGYALGHALAARSNQNDAARAMRPGAPAWGWRVAALPHWAGPARSQGALGTPRGAQERPGSITGASQERLGTSPGRPGSARGVTKGTPGRQKGRPGASRSAPRRPKSTPSHVRKRENRVFFARPGCNAMSKRFFVDSCRFSGLSQSLRTLRSTAHANKNRGSALRAASRVARAVEHRKTTKMGRKIDPEASKTASQWAARSRSGAQVDRSWSRGVARTAKSIEVGRSGSVDRVGRGGQGRSLLAMDELARPRS